MGTFSEHFLQMVGLNPIQQHFSKFTHWTTNPGFIGWIPRFFSGLSYETLNQGPTSVWNSSGWWDFKPEFTQTHPDKGRVQCNAIWIRQNLSYWNLNLLPCDPKLRALTTRQEECFNFLQKTHKLPNLNGKDLDQVRLIHLGSGRM